MDLAGCVQATLLGEDPFSQGARLQPPSGGGSQPAWTPGGELAGWREKVPGSCTREVGEGPSHGGAKRAEVVQGGNDAPRPGGGMWVA